MRKTLLARLGLGLSKLFGKYSGKHVSPLSKEREKFEQDVRNQFVLLRKKGLSIPVFTL